MWARADSESGDPSGMHWPRDYYKIGLRALLLHLAPLARDEIRGKDLCKMMQ